MDSTYWTQTKIGEVTGKGRTHVSEFIQFLGLPEEIKEAVRRRTLTAGHTVELLRINNSNQQKSMANKSIESQWTAQ